MTKDLDVHGTGIPGLLVVDLAVHEDGRGWFKENWQRDKMTALGLPDFGPVQDNMSFNSKAGTTRGIHAEPWDKLVSVAHGRVFGAWVDLRSGQSFGRVHTAEIDPSAAVFVPRGVANAFQTLEDETVYSYLVNDHWRPDASYTFVNLADESVDISWPIPLDRAEVSDKDRLHPRLVDVHPVEPLKTLILGANGQLGQALAAQLPEADAVTRAELDLARPDSLADWRWDEYDTIINAAAYTKVDEAETSQGRREAWLVNVTAVTELARIAVRHRMTLVHMSSDYVFDGEVPEHDESEGFSPLGVYGQTKAAGDAVVSTVPQHYIVRTSWVIGDGHNFIRTMEGLAAKGTDPTVVDDQIGRLTYTTDLARAIRRLLVERHEYGTYHVTSDVPARSWHEIAQDVFRAAGRDPADVGATSTAEYAAGRTVAPRPRHSSLGVRRRLIDPAADEP